MPRVHKFHISSTRSNDIVCRLMAEAEAKGTMMRRAGRYEGRQVELNGRMLEDRTKRRYQTYARQCPE